jgi:hypothetical protein
MKDKWDSMNGSMKWFTLLTPVILAIVGGGGYKLGTDVPLRNEIEIKHVKESLEEVKEDTGNMQQDIAEINLTLARIDERMRISPTFIQAENDGE